MTHRSLFLLEILLSILPWRNGPHHILVEEEFGYTKLIYLKYTSKICEVYFPKVFLKITVGVDIFTNTYVVRWLEIVHIFTFTKQIIEIVYKSTIFLGHVYIVLEHLVLRLYTNNTILLRLLRKLQSYRHGR